MAMHVYLSAVFALTLQLCTCLFVPMTDPNGDIDIHSVVRHVTYLEQTIMDTQKQLQTSNGNVNSLMVKLSTAENQLSVVSSELQTAISNLTVVQTQLNPTRTEVVVLNHRVAMAENKIKNLQNETSVNLLNLESENVQLKLQLNELQALLMNTTVIDQMSKDITDNSREVQELKSELVDANHAINASRGDIEMYRQAEQVLEFQCTNLTTTVSQTETSLELLKDSFEHQVNVTNALTSIMTGSSNNTHVDIAALETKIMELDQKVHENQGNMSLIVSTMQQEVHNHSSIIAALDKDVIAIGNSTSKTDTQLQMLHYSVNSSLSGLTKNLTAIYTQSSIGNADLDIAFQASPFTERSWSVLAFDSVDYNHGNGYNATTGVFTAPVEGTYIFWVSILIHGVSSNVFIVKGQERLSVGYGALIGMSYGQAATMSVTHLNKGNTVYFYIDSTRDDLHNKRESVIGGALLHRSQRN